MNSGHLYSTSQNCAATHSYPKTGQARTRTDHHCASVKQPAKADHSSVACLHEI